MILSSMIFFLDFLFTKTLEEMVIFLCFFDPLKAKQVNLAIDDAIVMHSRCWNLAPCECQRGVITVKNQTRIIAMDNKTQMKALLISSLAFPFG